MAPLAHHIFDSTHMATDVILGRLDHGIFSLEGSVFHGREPDEHHYDLDFGTLDSWSARVWLRPAAGWLIQASHGFLEEPEALEPGDQRRTNVSASWSRHRNAGFTAITAAIGRNRRHYSSLDSFLIEGTHKSGKSSFFARFEHTEVETEILLFPQIVHVPHPGELVDPVQALTIGLGPRHRDHPSVRRRARRRRDVLRCPAAASEHTRRSSSLVSVVREAVPLRPDTPDVGHDNGAACRWRSPAPLARTECGQEIL